MRRAMANVRDNKVIYQMLINTTEAVAESVSDSTANSDQTLQDNIVTYSRRRRHQRPQRESH